MDEKVKDKDAGQARDDRGKDLDVGLEGTFPASDPVSATRQRKAEVAKSETAEDQTHAGETFRG